MWLMGIVLIVAFCMLVANHFDDSNVLVLDGVVAVVAYTVGLYSFTNLFKSTGEFAEGVPALGMNIYISGAYIVLAALAIIVGLAVPLSFKWQLLIQGACVFILVVGILTGLMGNQRLTTVAAASQQRHQATDQLELQAQQLKMMVLRVNDSEVQGAINKLADRVRMLSPSTSAIARDLEAQLAASMRRLATMSTDDKEALLKEIEQAQLILKQRMATY